MRTMKYNILFVQSNSFPNYEFFCKSIEHGDDFRSSILGKKYHHHRYLRFKRKNSDGETVVIQTKKRLKKNNTSNEMFF